MSTTLNDEIMSKFKAGDSHAFTLVYKHFFQQLYYFSRHYSGSEEEGKEIAQESLLKLWVRRHNFDTLANIKAFLFISAKNACLNYRKLLERQRKYAGHVLNTSEIMEANPLQKLIKAEVLRALSEEIDNIPGQPGIVFHKIYFEKKTPKEIADEMGISVETVRSHKSLAWKYLLSLPLQRKLLLIIILLLTLLGCRNLF